MHHEIRARAHKAGFFESEGRLVILGCGAEHTRAILDALRDDHGTVHPVDTLISIFTLCSVPNQEKAIRGLVCDVLKPGGQMVYYEHVRNPKEDVAGWQALWSPVWSRVFGGCRLNMPTDRVVAGITVRRGDGQGADESSVWSDIKQWKAESEVPEDLFWRVQGRLVKSSS